MIGTKVGAIDKAGKIVITPQFDAATLFVYGRARVKLCCGPINEAHPGDKWGFIDSEGHYIGAPEYRWVGQFSGNRSTDLAPVQFETGQFGFINRSGVTEIPALFDSADFFGFAGGPAPVKKEEKWGFIGRTGKWVINPQFDEARDFVNGWAAVAVSGKWGYIDSSGRFSVNPQFDSARSFVGGHAPVLKANRWILIDAKGIPVPNAEFLDVGVENEGLRQIKTADGWGYTTDTKIVIAPIFDGAERFLGGLARVSIASQKVYVDKTGAYVGDPFKGHTVRPAHAVQEIWEGEMVGPQFSRMLKN